MIKAFKNKGLERFATKGDASKLSVQNVARLERILKALNRAGAPEVMNVPGWHFHQLTGDRRGTYSVAASGNWRVTFKWDGQVAVDVDLEDYH